MGRLLRMGFAIHDIRGILEIEEWRIHAILRLERLEDT